MDVFGLGQCSLDYLGIIEAYPPADAKCEMKGLIIQGGGPTATALVALSRWRVRCYFAGQVGDDPAGELILASLRQEGIDTGGVMMRKSASSQQAFIVAEPKTATRTIFWQRPTGHPLKPAEIDLAALGSAKVFHTDGQPIEAALFAAGEAKKKGLKLILDGGSLRPGMLDLVRLVDYCIVAEDFARELVGGDDPSGACRKLAELGPALAAVTLGKRGYVYREHNSFHARPAYRVPAVDTTGCGDVFHAGFIFGLLAGWTTAESLDLGAWAAAQVSLALGGRTNIPRHEEVLAHHRGRRGDFSEA